jgi:hypothetical protein
MNWLPNWLTPDAINASFIAFGALTTWLNVRQLLLDREVKGVVGSLWWFYTTWGLWNLYYYPHLGQMFSFWAEVVLVSGNITWLGLFLFLVFQKRQQKKDAKKLGQFWTD